MKAFWWFKENAIAGMARPGFNGSRWFDLPFAEALIYGWIGQFSSDSKPVESLHHHIRSYGPKIAKFYELSEANFRHISESFCETKKNLDTFERLAVKTKSIQSFELVDGHISFKLNEEQLQCEIDFLNQQGISAVIALTEKHHHNEFLQDYFHLHHFSIEDLQAPQFAQVRGCELSSHNLLQLRFSC